MRGDRRASTAGSRGADGGSEILPRIATLDGLRGIAILLVLFHNLDALDSPSSSAAAAIDMLLDRGWIGVQLFFVLSGFLITSILLRTRAAANYFQVFYARRVLRIFPLYYLTLAVFLWLLPFVLPQVGAAGDPVDSGHQLWLWLFLSNWVDPVTPTSSLFPHFWSLAVEEQFYLVWPLLVLVLQPRQLLWTCGILTMAALVIRAVMLATGCSHEAVYMFTVCRMDALAVGAAIAIAADKGTLRRFSPRAVAVALICTLAVGWVITRGYPRTTPLGQTAGYTILAVCCGLLLYYALVVRADSASCRVLQSSFLRMFGKYSYGIYVLHAPLNQLLGRPLLAKYAHRPIDSLWMSVSYTIAMSAAVLLTAMVVFHGVERPFLNLKRFFRPSEPSALPSV